MGATAFRALTGRTIGVMKQRGQVLLAPDGKRVLVTVHPSYLLRLADRQEAHRQQRAFVADLHRIGEILAGTTWRNQSVAFAFDVRNKLFKSWLGHTKQGGLNTMEKNIEYQIMAHENGWAVVISDVIRGVYPSRHLALAAAKLLESEMLPAEEARRFATTTHMTLTDTAAPNRMSRSFQIMVAAPHQVDVPLRRRSGEISFPSSNGGLDLSAGKG